MEYPPEKARRRRLLKNTVVAGGGVIVGKLLPDTWSKPVVDSILLPAHAATTDAIGALADMGTTVTPIVNPCVGETATIGADKFAIDIIFDGVSTPYFSIRSEISSFVHEDTIVGISKTPSFAIGPKRNWEMGVPRVETNVADGLYTRTVARTAGDQPTGERFEIAFCIATSGADASRTLTVTLVSIRKL